MRGFALSLVCVCVCARAHSCWYNLYARRPCQEAKEVEFERDGMQRLLDFEEDLVEASKKKGGIVRILEKELNDKEVWV